ncbi:pyrroloquinoline quinone precursor peptide PqqA [Actinokineospora sp. NBRC 105648]
MTEDRDRQGRDHQDGDRLLWVTPEFAEFDTPMEITAYVARQD